MEIKDSMVNKGERNTKKAAFTPVWVICENDNGDFQCFEIIGFKTMDCVNIIPLDRIPKICT